MSLPVPASTVAIICDTEDGLKVLMVQRHQNLANSGGAWAFPGGRVEEEDYQDTSDHFLAAQCAAVRETIEETGLDIDISSLIPFAHWTTPAGPRRRYATWFFITEVSYPLSVRVDGSEIVDHCWLTPAEVLDRHRQGKMEITPPGFVTLTHLNVFNRSEDALKDFDQRETVHFNPRLLNTEDGRVVFYEGDAGYDQQDINAVGERNRVTIKNGIWRYVNSTLNL